MFIYVVSSLKIPRSSQNLKPESGRGSKMKMTLKVPILYVHFYGLPLWWVLLAIDDDAVLPKRVANEASEVFRRMQEQHNNLQQVEWPRTSSFLAASLLPSSSSSSAGTLGGSVMGSMTASAIRISPTTANNNGSAQPSSPNHHATERDTVRTVFLFDWYYWMVILRIRL